MYSKVNYTIVGIFVLLFGAGVIIFGFWLAKYGLKESYATYKIEMKDSIAGLSKDSSVKLHGVDIGRVSQIRINPKDIRHIDIYLEIQEDIPIKEDMVASTQMLGVTGLLSIEIHGGTNEAKTLVPRDDYIPVIKSKPSLISKLTDNLGNVTERFNLLLTQSQKLLSSENIKHFSDILKNLDKASSHVESLEVKSIDSLKELDITLKAFRVSMDNINQKFIEATGDFKMMQKDFASISEVTVPTIEKFMQTSKNFNRLSLKVERTVDRGDYNFRKILEPVLIDIQVLTTQLSNLSRQLDQNPSDLFFKSRKSRRGPGE